jgi:hypothetical protein
MSPRHLAAPAVLVLATIVSAQEPKLPDVKTFDKLVVDTLRDVHNRGADLYNLKKEFEGTYRMYHGSLLTVRPLLGHRPEAQKLIDDGLAAAEKEMSMAHKAIRLHETIEAVRSNLKGESVRKSDDKKPKDKKPEDMKSGGSTGKGTRPVAAAGGPGFRGTVTLKGQPLPAGEVILVSLDKPKPIVIAATIQGDGQYAPMEVVPPGKYVVIVKGKAVPEKYQLTTTSGLQIDVQGQPAMFDIDLN